MQSFSKFMSRIEIKNNKCKITKKRKIKQFMAHEKDQIHPKELVEKDTTTLGES